MTATPYRSIEPATGETSKEYGFTTDAQIEEALVAAGEAFAEWRARPMSERAAIVGKVADLFKERAQELGELATKEMGKPIGESAGEADFCGDIFRYYVDNGEKLTQDLVLAEDEDGRTVVESRPLGALLGIMPWNYPFYQVARFAAPNLVLGNVILLKHAESVPGCAEAIQKIMDDAGVPEGVYRNIFADHSQISTIIEDPRVQGVSLTGSERAGAAVAEQAGRALKKVVLELGGSDPYVILSSDDPREAARTALTVRLENTGQACNSNKRLIVMDDVYEEFVDELVKQVSALEPGDPLKGGEGTFGPMSSEGAAKTIVDQIERAKAAGATVHVGGERLDRPGFWVSPAVVTDVPRDSDVHREEFFGPVATVYRVSSDEEALELANDTQYGLGATVFAVEEGRAEAVADKIDSGMVGVNGSAPEAEDMPFGGVKRSGYGRELGPLGMDEFVNKRLVHVAKRK
ncbi:NAD-dependent succinate-semialdehyde dehydrogenase [Corynebacterium sp. 335C]